MRLFKISGCHYFAKIFLYISDSQCQDHISVPWEAPPPPEIPSQSFLTAAPASPGTNTSRGASAVHLRPEYPLFPVPGVLPHLAQPLLPEKAPVLAPDHC